MNDDQRDKAENPRTASRRSRSDAEVSRLLSGVKLLSLDVDGVLTDGGLYYADDGHSLRAASQVKALLAGGGVATTPEPAGHVGLYLWGYVPEPYTLFAGIRALPAGSTLWIDGGGARSQRSFCAVAGELAECAGLVAPPDAG